MKLIIGVVADISAGKDTVARYLAKKHDFERHTLSDIIRAEARKRKVKPTRENLYKIIEEIRARDGKEALVKRVIKKFKKNKIVISGIREKKEIEYLRKTFPGKVKILRLTADAKLRFERVKQRNRIGDPKTFKEFLKQEKREQKKFNFKIIFKMADLTIENKGTINELYKKIDCLLKAQNI